MMDVADQQLPPTGPRIHGPRAYQEIIHWMIVAGFVVALVLLYSRNQAEIRRIQYQMEELEADNQRLNSANGNLRAEYRLLTNPHQIRQKALDLGLISANQLQVRIIQVPARDRLDSSLLAAVRKSHKVSIE